jgi:arylesterase/paraoxonase
MVLHRASSLIYASCSDPESRVRWQPSLNRLSKPKVPPESDFFAIIDTALPLSTDSIKRVNLVGLPTDRPDWRGLNFVGLDVVDSDTKKDVLWIYVINHRPSLPPAESKSHGADSSVEVFKTTVGSDTFEYVRTVEDSEYIMTPNDVVGLPDGSGFWISNDHSIRVGIVRMLLLCKRSILTFQSR